jgi:hypothetical protein
MRCGPRLVVGYLGTVYLTKVFREVVIKKLFDYKLHYYVKDSSLHQKQIFTCGRVTRMYL